MKTVFKILFILALAAYLIFAFAKFTSSGNRAKCEGITVVITDSAHAGFITASEAEGILQKARIHPVGEQMDKISTKKIEDVLKKNPFIKDAVCYKTPDRHVNLIINQRLPLLRIMADNGEDYYIDEYGYSMAPMGYVADLAVATGNIDKNFAKKNLVKLGKFLRDNNFWNNQVEQINVMEDHSVELVPRVGNQMIDLGSCDSLEVKFRNLKAFYENAMPQVGWNKYSRLNLEHTNQVIGTKRENNK